MNDYLLIKTLHIFSATIVFGTGIGIAFFMLRSQFTNNLHEKLYAACNTVLADYLFTLPAVVVQPVTGIWLVWKTGYHWADLWLVATYIIYIVAGLCWLPVILIQIRLKNILMECVETGAILPDRYHALFKAWFMLGWPAFVGLIVIFFLMVFKPI